jgi:glycosyltransferase involved in cell wall biosynthesis/GT2 family glycosyltransferase
MRSPQVTSAEGVPGPLEVCVVCPFGFVGGAERWLLTLLGATVRLRAEAVLLAEGPLRDALVRRGIAVTVRPTGRRPTDILGATSWLAGRFRHRRPDVVLANGVKAAMAAVPAARLTGVPVIWAKHDHSFDRWLARPLARLSDRLVAAAPELADPAGRADAVIVPAPRPDRDPAPREEARHLWSSRGIDLGDGPTLVMLTRLVPNKGVDDAVAALTRPESTGWRLVVVGGEDPAAPAERQRLEALAARWGVADRVRFTGWVENAGHWLTAFDALAVLTKRDERGFGPEGFGTAGFEAMLAAVPVIAVDGGAVAHRLAGQGGIIVPPADPSAVGAALGVLSSPELRRRMGRAGRELLADHPTAVTCADRLASVLAEAASRPGVGLTGGGPVSIVTTVLNEGDAVDHLLRATLPQMAEDDEIVVVDGGSRDDTLDRVEGWARRDRRVHPVSAPGINISGGRNRGVAAAEHSLIACTDAGCLPGAGWLGSLRAAFLEAPRPGLVAGVYRVTGGTPFREAMAAAGYPDPEEARRPRPLARIYGQLLGRAYDPTMPTGRSMAFTKAAWSAVGGFPEHLGAGEDVAFGRSVAAAGYRCVLQVDAEVRWDQRPTVAQTAIMYYRYGVGDGLSGDRRLIGRNLARGAAYVAAPLLLRRGGRRARAAVLMAALGYVSLPLLRARRRPRPGRVASLVPLALAVKDVAKAAGCLTGLLRRHAVDPALRTERERGR